jgi:excisionase family DNA binding protein
MTLREAALVLGVDPSTLRHQIKNGKLRAVKFGRDWLVTGEECARYRRENQR